MAKKVTGIYKASGPQALKAPAEVQKYLQQAIPQKTLPIHGLGGHGGGKSFVSIHMGIKLILGLRKVSPLTCALICINAHAQTNTQLHRCRE